MLAALLLGYHPYAEDGGIYAAAAASKADASLFPADRSLVTGHTAYSLFTPLVASAIRVTHASPELILLLTYGLGLALLVLGAMHLAETCWPGETARSLGAGIATAIGAGLPVAGTALYAVDPYTTARTITSPLLLIALSVALRRRWRATMLLWLVAATLHPLMAFWSGLLLAFVAAWRSRYPLRVSTAIAGVAFALALAIRIWAPAESAVMRQLALTRAYWFPAEWRWFEWLGAIAPPLLLVLIAQTSRPKAAGSESSSTLRTAAAAATVVTLLAIVLAVCFVREQVDSFLLARVQILRVLQPVFVVFLALGGAWLGGLGSTRTRRVALAALALVAATGAVAAQRGYFAHTRHFEWPGADSGNGWQQAFRWCRDHTEPTALFALDADYIYTPGEDAHGFRAIAHRSALPDGVKDAGVAAVLPRFAATWKSGADAGRNLDSEPDTQRRSRLLPLHVQWVVLSAEASTSLPCPYHNTAAKVCTLP